MSEATFDFASRPGLGDASLFRSPRDLRVLLASRGRPRCCRRRLVDDRLPRGAARLPGPIRPLLRWPPLRAAWVTGLRLVAARRIRRELRSRHLTLRHAIEVIERRWGDAVRGSTEDNPIFIFGAGWRCGSTWVQRLVMSSGKALIWGEPFDRSGIVQTMSGQLLPFGEGWPPDEWFARDAAPITLADQWVANLYPPLPMMIEAHRTFFRHLLEVPAREHGIARWGLKEVRLTTAHARYLRLLFPGAKFVFLIRNPFHAYGSYRGAALPWFERWPDRLTVTARQFGRVWTRLTEDFLENHAALGGLLLRYEDLVSDPGTVERLSAYLDLALSPATAARPLRGDPQKKEAFPFFERRLLMSEVRGPARRLGYR